MSRRILFFALFVGGLATLYVAARENVSLATLTAKEAALRSALGEYPVRGFAIGFAVYVGVSLVPGTTGKAIVAAWLFGFWAGLLMVNIGLTVAAIGSFSASRYLFHDLVASHWERRLTRVNHALARDGPSYLFAARVLHVPFCVTNYVMGATPIRLRGFWWSTQLGILPGNVIFVYAGSQAPTLETIAEEGFSSILSPGLIIAFIAMSVFPLLVRALVHRVLRWHRHRR
ncbi:MAG: TVP38/TMEM64 family protein [Phycisphaerales bacterium]|nr:VTT domain-containing protein [Phycisphaerae bacterium]NNF41465.1 TVP38/TMEM64 family protein [Phycisphaerales bacterium]NNM25015.1 TVP38/TMEM64 family protein [Phycisphaerales bacterium]